MTRTEVGKGKLTNIKFAGRKYNLELMDKDELLVLKIEMDASLAATKTRIRRAQVKFRETGITDDEWYISAKHSRAYKSRQIQIVSMMIGRRSKEEKDRRIQASNLRNETIGEHFVHVSRERLPEKEFRALYAVALDRMEQQMANQQTT